HVIHTGFTIHISHYFREVLRLVSTRPEAPLSLKLTPLVVVAVLLFLISEPPFSR
ncbi:unnamed protein product, partial [Amoebophrya sp. A25]